MPPASINLTIGTAGHIDHGKTALVRMLTGCETDRLKEEKERGMSIDLGFAPCTIAGRQVGVVDVPGHEHFIKTMVAGAAGVDAVILVVAADDSVMPQTREHLDILTLLGVRHGVVALTKIDRVEPDHVALARDEVGELVRGTFLAQAPILPLSNVTGEGFDSFVAALWEMVESVRPRRLDGVFRLPVDRAFSVRGYGTVIAGVPAAGAAAVGEEVVLLPRGLAGRVRRIEVYGLTAERVLAGQCAAVNVGHWGHRDVRRGDVLTLPGFFEPAAWFTATLRLLPLEKLALKSGGAVKLHTGTSEVSARIYPLAGAGVAPGEDHLVQFRLEQPVVAGPGDRYIVRTFSPVRTVGGGMLLEAAGRRLKRNRPEILDELARCAAAIPDEPAFVAHALRTAPGRWATAADLARRVKLPHSRVAELLLTGGEGGRAVPLPAGRFVHTAVFDEVAARLESILSAHHQRVPESPGMTPEDLRDAAGFEKDLCDAVVARLVESGRLAAHSGRLAVAGHEAALGSADAQQFAEIEAIFRRRLFQPPSVEELVEATAAPAAEIERLLRLLAEHQRLVAVEGIFFHSDALQRARELLVDYIQREGRLESVQFKYLIETTRKFALPLLDHFDRVGLLRRVGNTRYLRARID